MTVNESVTFGQKNRPPHAVPQRERFIKSLLTSKGVETRPAWTEALSFFEKTGLYKLVKIQLVGSNGFYVFCSKKGSFLCKMAEKFHVFCFEKVLFCAEWQGSSIKEVFKIVLSCAKWQESCINFRIPQFKSFNPVFVLSMINRVESELDRLKYRLCILLVQCANQWNKYWLVQCGNH